MWHFFDDDYVLTVPEPCDPSDMSPPHSHHALQLSVALREPLRWSIAEQAPRSAAALLIAPDVPHHVVGGAALMCEPESELGRRLLGRLSGKTHVVLDDPALARLGRALLAPNLDADDLSARVTAAIDAITADFAPAPPLDARVCLVIERLRNGGSSPRLAELAREVNLSPGRLRHLFVQEVGLPIRKYVLWLRSIEALHAMMETPSSLSAAAHKSGFADHAALSRTHRRFFGRTPSQFTRDRVVRRASGEDATP
jgi:AraC-like DNA-binding protein